MKAGTSQICITPPDAIDLTGFGGRPQPHQGVHDDLYMRGLCLEQSGERLLWLHCDLLGLDTELVRQVRSAICAQRPVLPRQVLISATHTHAGPATQRLRGCGEMNAEYMAALAVNLLDAARTAIDTMQDASLWFGEGRCVLGTDRRTRWYGPKNACVDHTLPVLAFKRPDGSLLAVVSNYAMHNVGAGQGNRLISADISGAVAETLHRELPGRPVVLCTNAAAGNVDPPALADDFSAVERFGAILAADIRAALPSLSPATDTTLSSTMTTMHLPVQKMSREEVIASCSQEVAGGGDKLMQEEWRDHTLRLLDAGRAPDHVEIDLQAVRIGPARFAAIPAEVFCRMTLALRELCGPHTYVVGYANGNIGYLPFAEIYDEGGYEPAVSYKVYGNFNLARNAFALVRDVAAAQLSNLNAAATPG